MNKKLDLSNAKLIAPPPKQDLSETITGPCFLINRFYLMLSSTGIRAIFAEQVTPDTLPQFRSAVNIPMDNARNFAQTFMDFVEKSEKRLEQEAGNGNGKNGS
jgi:hypothetical protein